MYKVIGVRLANTSRDPNELVVVLELEDGRQIEVIHEYHGGGMINTWTNCDLDNEGHREVFNPKEDAK